MGKDGEILIHQTIGIYTYQAHLIESKIRQVLNEGDNVRVVLIRKVVKNGKPMGNGLSKTNRDMVSNKQPG